jgi:putative DNA primase/helicase
LNIRRFTVTMNLAHSINQKPGQSKTNNGASSLLSFIKKTAGADSPAYKLLNSLPHEEYADLPEYLTDLRMAESFIEFTKDYLRYWHESGEWMDFDGTRWLLDSPGGAHKYIKDFLAPLFNEVEHEEDKQARDIQHKALLSRESMTGQNNLLKAAAVQPTACISTKALDSDPWLLNTKNATIDLRSGEPQAHRNKDFITKIADITSDPTAECPEFHKFITRIMGNDTALIAYMQRWIGYCLTGNVSEHVFQVWYGTGANGKSVLAAVLAGLLGEYTKAAGSYLLLQKNGGGSDMTTQAELAKLRGTRLARISETDEGARFAEAQLKNITGGDTITCRTLYKKPFEYDPEFKIILLCNHKPQVRGTDDGIWRRIHIVPFSVTIPLEEQDHDLKHKLLAELPGILNWAIAGCLAWQQQGLNPPQSVMAAIDEYKSGEDMFATWLNDCCDQSGNYTAKAKELLDSFKAYSGWKNTSHKKFGTMLAKHGFTKSTSNGVVWNGLELSEPLNTFSEKSHEKPLYGKFALNPVDSSKGSIDMDELADQL